MSELGHSKLGTLDFWTNRYQLEIENYKDHGDMGEIWFGQKTLRAIVAWVTQNISELDAKIVDLGCGNGMLCMELYKQRYTNLKGIDYCADAIELATQIAKDSNCNITYTVGDILQPSPENDVALLLDKGTFDAISYNSNSCSKYIENVSKMLIPNGLLLITSCNWTAEELTEQFSNHFQLLHVIPMTQFVFGGLAGSTVSSIVFKLKST